MLKSRCLKSCVALVVFCFSLVVCCISPAWGFETTPVTSAINHNLVINVSYGPGVDPEIDGLPMAIPTSGNFALKTLNFTPSSNPGSASSGMSFRSAVFEPFEYDVTLVLGYTFAWEPNGSDPSATFNYSASQFVAMSSDAFHTSLSDDRPSLTAPIPYRLSSLSGGVVWTPLSAYMFRYGIFEYSIRAGTNQFYIDSLLYSNWSVPVATTFCGTVMTAYLIHSGDVDIVKQVNAILDQVKQINGNMSSALDVLNQILVQCQSIKADTSAILGVLQLISADIVALNGKVDNIYDLLKNALAEESAAVDKKSEELGGQIMQRVDSEQYWSDKNTENFESLNMGDWTFGDGVVGALPTVGNLFKSLWDSIGDTVVIFTFPLMLGIALVIIGRISRTAGKGGKKGGGDDG